MGLIGFVLTVAVGAVGGWVLKGKVDKKDKQDPFKDTPEY